MPALGLWKLAAVAAAVAAGSASPASQAPVALKVGSVELTQDELQARVNALPSLRVSAPGAGPAESAETLVTEHLVPLLRMAEAARQRHLDLSPRFVAERQEILRSALIDQLRHDLQEKHPVTDVEVASFYRGHLGLFVRGQRLRLYRILLDTHEQAERLLAEMQKKGDLETWQKLAREHSVDKATAERGGDLGFVAQDGTTDVPELRVDPELYRKAAEVGDGDLVAQPVAEGKRFAVVWRRGTVAPKERKLEQEAPGIREFLLEQHVSQALADLLAGLKKTHLRDYHPERLEGVRWPSPDDPLANPVGSATTSSTE